MAITFEENKTIFSICSPFQLFINVLCSVLIANTSFCCKIFLLFVCSFVSPLVQVTYSYFQAKYAKREKQTDTKLNTINKKHSPRQCCQLSLPAEHWEYSAGQFPAQGYTYYWNSSACIVALARLPILVHPPRLQMMALQPVPGVPPLYYFPKHLYLQ